MWGAIGMDRGPRKDPSRPRHRPLQLLHRQGLLACSVGYPHSGSFGWLLFVTLTIAPSVDEQNRLRWAKNVLKHSVIIPAAQQKEHEVSIGCLCASSMF